MYKISIRFLALLLPLITGGCAKNVEGDWKVPFVYRIDVQQGNVVDQKMIDKLKPGMDKNQVKFVMGTPLIQDPFHSDRWDYIYIMEPGSGERKQRRITLFFENDKLAYVDGDIKIGDGKTQDDLTSKDRAVAVPLDEHEKGFFSKLFSKDKPQNTDLTEETATIEETGAEVSEEEISTEKATTTEPSLPAPAARKETADSDGETDETENKETIAEKQQDRNLLRRFWDRVTSGAEDSGLAEGEEETERDIRDAEVLESAGGEL